MKQNQLMNSPSHAMQQQQQHIRHRSLSQVAGVNAGVRLSSVSSQDSGFTSQDTLVLYRPNSSPPSNQLLAQEVQCPTNNLFLFLLCLCAFVPAAFCSFLSFYHLYLLVNTKRWYWFRPTIPAESVRVPTATRARPALLIHPEWAPLGQTFKYINTGLTNF